MGVHCTQKNTVALQSLLWPPGHLGEMRFSLHVALLDCDLKFVLTQTSLRVFSDWVKKRSETGRGGGRLQQGRVGWARRGRGPAALGHSPPGPHQSLWPCLGSPGLPAASCPWATPRAHAFLSPLSGGWGRSRPQRAFVRPRQEKEGDTQALSAPSHCTRSLPRPGPFLPSRHHPGISGLLL